MEQLLTPQEKKYLRSFCNYLLANDMDHGNIRIDFDYDDLESIKVSNSETFDNAYTVKIPKPFADILDRLFKELHGKVDLESDYDLNYQQIDINVDVADQELEIQWFYSYNETSEVESTTWTKEEEPEVFQDIQNNNIQIPPSGLRIEFNGSGDSGYIEDDFEGNIRCPEDVQDWCYRKLESLHGGWEINEGSFGSFKFFPGKVRLNFYGNVENNESETIYSENFGS